MTGEGRNSPFFIHEFAAIAGSQIAVSEQSSLASVIDSRTEALDLAARLMLRVIAVAGGPLPEQVVRSAANVHEAFHQSRESLIESHLVRATTAASNPALDIYHARQRVALAAGVAEDEAMGLHLRIADALEKTTDADLERIYSHLRKARQLGRAAIYAERAGEQAASQLAFKRAARLFEEAVSIQPGVAASADLLRKLGNARANAGLGEGAAAAYMQAAEANPKSGLDLQILATEQLLRSGSVQAGLNALADVSRRASVPWARTRIGLYASIAMLRARLRIKSWKPRLRPRSPERLDQARICWIGAIGTAMSDPARSAGYSARHLLLALESNDLRRLCLAFAAEAPHTLPETYRIAAPEKLMAVAKDLSLELKDISLDAFLAFMEGIIACDNGQWRNCIELCDRALDLYRRSTSGIGWDRVTASSFILSSRILLGEWKTAANDLPMLVIEAEERGDR